MVAADITATEVQTRLLARNLIFERFFAEQSRPLAIACREMCERFLRGGRLLAFGRGPYATDAQHVSVEFVHPIIVGKRALPALDLSLSFGPGIDAVVQRDDIVMGFGPPKGDAEVAKALTNAGQSGAMTFHLPGIGGAYAFAPTTQDPFIHQELMELLYHTLWETVHVYFEHQELGYDVGDSGFLYPFLGEEKRRTADIADQVAASIRMKAAEDANLRAQVAQEQSAQILAAARAIHQRLDEGGKLIVFGNGGSATDANDFAIDCVCPPTGYRPVRAISLCMEPAILTAIANDVGIELIFARQLIAHARPEDVAVGISTSGGSRNVISALEEATRRGLLTVALLGYDGGEILRRGLAEHPLLVRSDYIPRIQEVQASTYHVIRDLLEAFRHA